MKESFEKAGISPVEVEFQASIAKFLNNGGSIERAYALLDAAAEKLPGEGLSRDAGNGHCDPAPSRQPNDEIEGKQTAAHQGPMIPRPASSPDRGSEGQNFGAHQGQNWRAPSREPNAAQRKAAASVAKKVATTVLDTFSITERQGSKTPIGDVPVSSYGRLLATLGKRAWVSSREYNLIYLLKTEADKQGHIPQGALTRDIFDVKSVEDKISTATDLALPREAVNA